MVETRKLWGRSFEYLVGRVCMLLLSLISFPVLTRMFSVSEYGLIALGLNSIALATVVSKMGLQNSLQRFYHEAAASADPNAQRRFYSTLFFGTMGIACMVTLIFSGGLWLVPDTLLSSDLRKLLFFAAALIFIRALTSIINGVQLTQGKSRAYNVLQISTKAATIAVVVLLLLTWNRTPEVFFLATTVVEATAILVAIPFVLPHRMLTPRLFDPAFLRSALIYGGPLVAAEISWLVLDTGDRFLVHYYVGSKALGYYSVAYNLCNYFSQGVTMPLSLALAPLCMEIWAKNGKEETQILLSRLLDHFLLITTGLLCVVTVTSHGAIVLLASSNFQEAHRLLPVILTGLVIGSAALFLQIGLLIYHKTLTIFSALVPACVLNLAMNVFLLPRMGIMGAAIATLASYFCMTLLYARYSQKLLPLKMEWMAWARYAVAGASTVLIVSRVVFGGIVLNLAIRAMLSLALYGGMLWIVDGRVRQLMATSFRTLFVKMARSNGGTPTESFLHEEELVESRGNPSSLGV